MSPVLPPEGSGSGFSQWLNHKNAVSIPEAVALLDPPPGHNGPSKANDFISSAVRFAEEAGSKADWFYIPPERVQPDLRFALALDIENGPTRACAILCRAFARASQIAALHAQEIIDRREAATRSSKFREPLERLTGLIDEPMFELLQRLYPTSCDMQKKRKASVFEAISTLTDLVDFLTSLGNAPVAFVSKVQTRGRIAGIGHLFLTCRILELWAIATGQKPSFYDTKIQSGRPSFLLMAYAAHSLTGTGSARRGEPGALTHILRAARTFDEEYGSSNIRVRWPEEFKSASGQLALGKLSMGDFASEGLACDVSAKPPPRHRGEAYEPI